MEELTESARQNLVSQGIVIGTLSVLNSLCLVLKGVVVLTRANDILHFTSLTYLTILEIVCGVSSLAAVAYIWWIITGYRNRQLEVRGKYLDESMTKGLIALILPLFITFSAFVISAIFLLLKTESSSTYDLKSAMFLYSTDVTRKVIIDKLQSLLQCCGSQSLLDWFLVDWQNADLEPGQHLENSTSSDWDSVPFSCCCPEAPPPCIHHQLRIFGVGSLFSAGCSDKLDEIILIYTARKLQTSARSAVQKGDATAPGSWWLFVQGSSSRAVNATVDSDQTPLLRDKDRPGRRASISIDDYWCKPNRVIMSPVLVAQKPKIISNTTVTDDWHSHKGELRHTRRDSSEDWTRRAYEPSESTSTTSFMTTSLPVNSTPDSRRSVSDTAVANLDISQHFEHKVRSLYRS
ncbi:hypothetical protein RUM44_001095 [Polyplax serrata]|uniref:Tetraspanin n=1 Tax=Polyplax serrata TaxID=468196 RepID=A0ABR1B9H0_POLSC